MMSEIALHRRYNASGCYMYNPGDPSVCNTNTACTKPHCYRSMVHDAFEELGYTNKSVMLFNTIQVSHGFQYTNSLFLFVTILLALACLFKFLEFNGTLKNLMRQYADCVFILQPDFLLSNGSSVPIRALEPRGMTWNGNPIIQ